MYWIKTAAMVFFAMHLAASVFQWPRNKTATADLEQVRQHHEMCAMLALIALAV